jgi:GT2 family glycosyltransferase
LAKLFPRTKLCNGYLYGERDPQTLDMVEQIEGSALMIPERARTAVGNLDSQFFLFFEEVDWCKRVRDAGFEIHVVQDAIIKHHRSTTMSRFFVPSRVHHAESAMKYFRKHHGRKGLEKIRQWMRRALLIRAGILRFVLLFKRDQTMRTKLEGTLAMRQIYRRGLLV